MMRYILIITAIFLFTSCKDSNNNKINNLENYIPKCSQDINDNSSAIKVLNGEKIRAISNNVKLRVWHYSDSSKLVCRLKGTAILEK